MEQQTIYIKGMVCQRCVTAVKEELQNLGHIPVKLALGEVSFFVANQAETRPMLEKRLVSLGFELLEEKGSQLARQVKQLVEQVYSGDFDFPYRFRFANYASDQLQKEYEAISDTFIALEKKTIEQYIIEFRIGKVKEFLVYSSLTLADIAFKLNFNSAAHLSTQFKQQTGLTPSYFKEIKKQKLEVRSGEL